MERSEDIIFYRIKNLAKHSLVYGLFDFLGRAGALVLVPLYAKLLSPSQYGVLELFGVSGALLLSVTVMGFNSALTRYFVAPEASSDRVRFFHTSLSTILAASVALTIIFSTLAAPLSTLFFGDESYALFWRLVALAVALDAIGAIVLSLLRAQTRPVAYSVTNLAKLLSILLFNVVLVGFLRQGVYGVLVGNCLGSVVGLGVGLWYARASLRLGFSRSHFNLLARFGLPLIVSALAMFVMNSIDRYFLKIYASLPELGAYALGYKIGMSMSLLVNAFVVAWPPFMFKIQGDPEAKTTFSVIVTYYVLATSILLLCVGSFGRELVVLIGTPEYASASTIVVFVLLSYLFQGAYYALSTGATITDHTRVVPVAVVLGAIVNLAADFTLIPRYGMIGAAWATVISYAVLPIAMFFLSQHYYPIRFETKRLFILVLISTLLLALNLTVFTGHGALWELGKLAVCVAFLLLLRVLRFFTDEEIAGVGRVFRKVVRRFAP